MLKQTPPTCLGHVVLLCANNNQGSVLGSSINIHTFYNKLFPKITLFQFLFLINNLFVYCYMPNITRVGRLEKHIFLLLLLFAQGFLKRQKRGKQPVFSIQNQPPVWGMQFSCVLTTRALSLAMSHTLRQIRLSSRPCTEKHNKHYEESYKTLRILSLLSNYRTDIVPKGN